MSSFFGLYISRSGMQAQGIALDVTAHNVANANTPGYSRQVSRMVTNPPLPYPGGLGMRGTGVTVAEITRIREDYLDMQIRKEMQTLGSWESREQVLSRLELIFMEPSDTGFNSVLSNFFDSWQEVSLSPESTPVRANLIESSGALVNTVRHMQEQFKSIVSDIDQNVALKVEEVNSLAEQIKDLNGQIITLVALGDTPGDLLDRRDLLLDRLAGLINYKAIETPLGAVNIFIGGRELVRENTAQKLIVVPGEMGEEDWTPAPQILWERDGGKVEPGNGEIGGLLAVREGPVKNIMHDFAGLVWGIVTAVNQAHSEGMDLYGNQGTAFFTGEHLETLQVNPLLSDPGRVAASLLPDDFVEPGEPNPGDGQNALKIAQLRHARLKVDYSAGLKERLLLAEDGEEGVTTFENYYKDTIAGLGVATQESMRMVENQDSLLDMMLRRREAIMGVSLDEELANMVQFQLAYQASARVITAFDEIYDTVINRMLR